MTASQRAGMDYCPGVGETGHGMTLADIHAGQAQRQPATAVEAWQALQTEGPGAEAVQSYLAPGPVPRYDTPQAREQAEMEAGS
jgi:hypothetical protein